MRTRMSCILLRCSKRSCMCMREDREVVEMMIRLPYRRGGPPMASACQTHSFPPISVATRYRENIRIYHCPRMPAFIARRFAAGN